MTTGKKALVAGGVVIGGYILYRMVSPAVVSGASKTPTTAVNTSIFSAAGQFFSGLISGANPKSGPVNIGSPATTWYTGVDPNSGIDPSTGGVRLPAGQVYGPPAPTVSASSGPSGAADSTYTDGSGDGLLVPTF